MTVLRALITAALLSMPAGAAERVTIHVSHMAQMAPAEVLIQAIVEPDAANRQLEIIAESSDFYRSSRLQLNGENGPRMHSICYSQMPAGTYDVIVRVLGSNDAELAAASETLLIG